MSSDETLQYLALALSSGFKGYVDRRQHMEDMQYLHGNEQDQATKREQAQANLEATRALTEQRYASADKADRYEPSKSAEDPFARAIKDVPVAHRYPVSTAVQKYLDDNGGDYEKAIKAAEDSLANTDKEFPLSPPGKMGEIDPITSQQRATEMKTQRDARTQRAMALGLMHRLRDLRAGGGPAPAPTPFNPQAQTVPGFKQFGQTTTGPYSQPLGPEPPPGMQSQQPMQGAAMGAGKPTGGALVTPPRMPQTPEVAAQNYQNFASAPQPGALGEDQRRAGELAELFTYVNDPKAPFPTQAMAWFRLHELVGAPIPQMFLTWATAQGVPRNVVDGFARQPQGQPAMPTQPLQPQRR
jgi:hypothetical protein